MTLTTNWQKQPDGILRDVFTFLDPISGYALSVAEQRTRDIFFSPGLLEKLIDIHFHCAPSPTLSPIDQHLALTTSLSNKARSVLSHKIIKLNAPPALLFTISKDLTQGLSADDQIFYLWNLPDGKLVHTFAGHTSPIEEMALSAGKAVTKSRSEIKIWDLDTKTCSKTITSTELSQLRPTKISPDLRQMLSVSPTQAQLWDLDTEKCLLTIKSEEVAFQHPPLFSLGADGKTVLISLDNYDVKLYCLATGKCLLTINMHERWVESLTMNDQSTKVYTTWGNIIHVWDRTKAELLETIDSSSEIGDLKISPDGNKIIANNIDGSFCILHHAMGKWRERLYAPVGRIQCEQISSDGTRALIVHEGFNSLEYLNLAPTPHERIHEAAMNCLSCAPDTHPSFQKLHTFIRQNLPLKTVRHYPLRSHNRIYYRDLCTYSAATFLPRIKKFLELSDLAKSAKDKARYSTSAYHRISQLPPGIQEPIYNRMSLLRQALGTPAAETSVTGYGERAFHNKEEGYATKLMAIEGDFTTVRDAQRFLRQRSLKNQPINNNKNNLRNNRKRTRN
jgi:WD40 repeat protein